MGRIVMGYWDCKYCSTKGVAGSEQECPNCGHPRDKDVKFYMSNTEAPKVVDKATEAKVRERGRDWTCLSCDNLNPGNVAICAYCGAPKDTNLDTPISSQMSNSSNERYKSPVSDSPYYHSSNSSYKPESSNKKSRDFNNKTIKSTAVKTSNNIFGAAISVFTNNWKKIIAIIGILLVVATAIFLLVPYDKQVEITGVSWSRSISIEEYKTVQESDWSVPSGGRIRYTKQEIHHYDEVIDHYETKTRQVIDHYEEKVTGYKDLGNGYFEEITTREPVYKTETYKDPVYRKDPVYATKYYYDIDKWLYERSVNTSGNDKSPYWGEVILRDKEREGSRSSKYRVHTDDGSKYTVSESDWYSLNQGDNVTLSVNRLGYAKIKSFEQVQ